MRKLLVAIIVIVVILAIVFIIIGHILPHNPPFGSVQDEAMKAGRNGQSMPGADEDYFADMDYGATKNPAQVYADLKDYLAPTATPADAVKAAVVGRNNWIVWTGGNDRLWDKLSGFSAGNLDLLKTISNYEDPNKPPQYRVTRSNRWKVLGLVNEPCYQKNMKPRDDRWGLLLDTRVEGGDCKPDPFENEQKYPGVAYGSRGKGKLALGSYYGYGTGIVGLRLFPNPDFDEKAQKNWNPQRYYTDPTYYNDKNLVKPYRVGMSCGFCHVGPNPSHPPADPENPKWADLNSNPGAQYFWIDRIFIFDYDTSSFVWQWFHTSRPGALDTSLVSSDNINNPRTMNAIYNLKARLEIAKKWGAEHLAGGELNNKQFNDFVPPLKNPSLLTDLWDPKTATSFTPHVLKDGSDSVGGLGALNRVYINIGLFSEEWLLHFQPLAGYIWPLYKETGIKIADLDKNSSYWQANIAQTPDVALFFLATAKPDYLKDAPGAGTYMQDAALVPHGKEVFAERCARCHSSKLPDKAFTDYFKPGCIGPNYMKCWNDYWAWTKTEDFKTQMKAIVNQPDFLTDNFLSTDIRVPSTLMETNSCSPLATNAIENNIWNDFSSNSYKSLPSVGSVQIHDPFTYKPSEYVMPGGGRGFTRPASLISLWSTAPYLQNNAVGHFEWSGSVPDRMAAFDDGIHQMLWPEKRLSNPPGAMFMTRSGKLAPGWIDTTTQWSYVRFYPNEIPIYSSGITAIGQKLTSWSGFLGWLFPRWFQGGKIVIGPIPQGTPINLLTNIDLTKPEAGGVIKGLAGKLADAPKNPTNEQLREHFASSVPDLLSVCKCKDFVVNRGHYFGTDYLPAAEGEPGLTDADKEALIAFLKTM